MSKIVPEALVPDVWRCEAARCPNCAALWHSEPRGLCETSCLNQPIIPRLRMPALWWNDPEAPADCA